ncbi:hypothetical protein FXE70_01450 [Vibrio cholerae]|nr:hypothetical protein FXE70_01450 [Vibrio cholerae]
MRGFLALPAGAWQSHLSQFARHPQCKTPISRLNYGHFLFIFILLNQSIKFLSSTYHPPD